MFRKEQQHILQYLLNNKNTAPSDLSFGGGFHLFRLHGRNREPGGPGPKKSLQFFTSFTFYAKSQPLTLIYG